MYYEIRLVVHQAGLYRPDYTEVHQRMERAGFTQITEVGGRTFHTLAGMYRSRTTLSTTQAIAAQVNAAMAGYAFEISYQVIAVSGEQDFNLKPSTKQAIYPVSAFDAYAAPAMLAGLVARPTLKDITPLGSALISPKKR